MVRTLILTAGAATLAVATPTTAQQTGANAPKPVTRAQVSAGLDTAFKSMDTNGDGFVSNAEMQAARTKELQQIETARSAKILEEFRKIDTNKDGQVTQKEFAAAFPPVSAPETPAQVVQALDTNKDGKVSPDEFKAPRLAAFAKVDANHDGTVTPEELRAARK